MTSNVLWQMCFELTMTSYEYEKELNIGCKLDSLPLTGAAFQSCNNASYFSLMSEFYAMRYIIYQLFLFDLKLSSIRIKFTTSHFFLFTSPNGKILAFYISIT